MSSTPEPLIATRSLTAVLRRTLDRATERSRLLVGEVTALVPGTTHVTVEIEGVGVTVPRLSGYAPQVGDAVYLIASGTILLAIGTVK